MAFLSPETQTQVRTIFEGLTGNVRLNLFTLRESPIFVPGMDCPTCKDARQLLQEVVALSDKLELQVHELSIDDPTATENNIQRLPALVLTADGVKGKVRYFGLPSGYEFSVLLGSMVDVSNAKSDLADETIELLAGVDKDLHLQVFVTPT